MRETLADAGTGALVTIVLSFLPFSSIAGGAVAAHRDGGGYTRGLWVGTLAGVAAMLPLLVLFVPALYIAGLLGFGIPPSAPAYDLFLGLVFGFFLAYTVGISAVGGVCGVWVRRNRDWNLDPGRWR
ncbi:DUF5518 domain-containing protein [Haloarcula halophila]|jgi:hypothetical protein|uniref:DUF5518 domain-containing protein n=1 Tax=Haloarcula TaxID=2237 RepID=UPI0023E3C144|nr:DUF5518 domain-containing protein [Halomicroarcula sp. DFY41]